MAERRYSFPEMKGKLPTWENYYEIAWAAREKVFEEVLASGETNLARVLSLFERFDLGHILDLGADKNGHDGTATFRPREGTGAPKLFTTDRKAVTMGALAPIHPLVDFDRSAALLEFSDGVDCAAEVGSGYGKQLFKLYL
jgi:hypothetical protein